MTARSTSVKVVKTDDTDDTTVTFEYDGEEYSFPQENLKDADVIEAIDDQKLTHVAKLVVGDKQYQLFKEKKRTVEDLVEFCKTAFEAAGASMGK